MLTAVWAAVVAAAAAFVIGVGVAIYVMLKAARLMTESSATLASLREREDVLIDQAGTAIDRVGEQIAMTETITASMDDVTASMAELRGRITALTPAAVASADGSRGALTWGAALMYGIARALGLRWAAQYRFIRRRQPGVQEAAAAPARSVRAAGQRVAGPRAAGPRAAGPRAGGPPVGGPRAAGPRVGGQHKPALNGRRGGVSP
jgi:hypothetical protein